jgi:hypothetical protein
VATAQDADEPYLNPEEIEVRVEHGNSKSSEEHLRRHLLRSVTREFLVVLLCDHEELVKGRSVEELVVRLPEHHRELLVVLCDHQRLGCLWPLVHQLVNVFDAAERNL